MKKCEKKKKEEKKKREKEDGEKKDGAKKKGDKETRDICYDVMTLTIKPMSKSWSRGLRTTNDRKNWPLQWQCDRLRLIRVKEREDDLDDSESGSHEQKGKTQTESLRARSL